MVVGQEWVRMSCRSLKLSAQNVVHAQTYLPVCQSPISAVPWRPCVFSLLMRSLFEVEVAATRALLVSITFGTNLVS